MNFDYSDDQKFLKSEARKFLDAQLQQLHPPLGGLLRGLLRASPALTMNSA